jgi:phenylacetate-coenzyme A ligase PaaK-like adenylate-forming protein
MVVKGAETCTCGMPFSTLRSVEGRGIDYFTLPGGRKMHPYYLTKHVFPMTLHLISQYLVVQHALDRITISLVFENSPDPGFLERLKQACQQKVGRDVTLNLQVVEHIPRSETGKTFLFRSRINISS